jgi:hypothetical protein
MAPGLNRGIEIGPIRWGPAPGSILPSCRISNKLRAGKSVTYELDSGLIFDGCGLMASFSLRTKSSDGAFSRHPKCKVAHFCDMVDHEAHRKPRVNFNSKPEGIRMNSFSEQ